MNREIYSLAWDRFCQRHPRKAGALVIGAMLALMALDGLIWGGT